MTCGERRVVLCGSTPVLPSTRSRRRLERHGRVEVNLHQCGEGRGRGKGQAARDDCVPEVVEHVEGRHRYVGQISEGGCLAPQRRHGQGGSRCGPGDGQQGAGVAQGVDDDDAVENPGGAGNFDDDVETSL